MSSFSLARAGRWFLESGIQEPSGGVARFYRSEIAANRAVSAEITGYTASALAWLFSVTQDEQYLDRARHTARFLVEEAWSADLQTFPFEPGSPYTYFFDCGIIVRGLLAVWRQTGEAELLAVATAAAHSMLKDFGAGADCHPILELPARIPVERTSQWSRSPGCYQLKSALAWHDVAEVTGDETLRAAWETSLASSLASHTSFLPETTNETTRYGVMDRLHAYCYFLEVLPPGLRAPGIATVERHLREISPAFLRSDVCAQLLRARPERGSAEEAETIAQFQMTSDDPRIDGGFSFGRRDGVLSPHINPVSTAFAMQALYCQESGTRPCRQLLI